MKNDIPGMFSGQQQDCFLHNPVNHILVNVTFQASPYTSVITFWTTTVDSPPQFPLFETMQKAINIWLY
jgi:hypothetical protein